MIEIEYQSGTLLHLNPHYIVSVKGFKYTNAGVQGSEIIIQCVNPEPIELMLNEIKKITIANREYIPTKTTYRNIMRKISDEVEKSQ